MASDNSLFPSILPGEDFVDNEYSRGELERMEWDELRGIASEHPSEDVNGKMDREGIVDGLVGKERI